MAVLWGGMAGKIVFYAIDHVLFLGFYQLGTIDLADMGIIYGVPTGVTWWLLQRRAYVAESG